MQERYFFTDRFEAASGFEDESDTAWQEFQRLAAGEADADKRSFAVSSKVPPLRTWDSAADVLAWMERHHRVCPRPDAWFALHSLLLQHAVAPDVPPPPPADTESWRRTSQMTKSVCFGDHLRWAERRPAALESAAEFLLALPEDAWLRAEVRLPASS